MTAPSRTRVLFLCTGNSCRSQMAEGWGRCLKGDEIEFYSAGVETHGLNPDAVRVMAEAFMGRLDAYSTALDDGDREALAAAIGRNLLRGDGAASAELVDFVLALEARLSVLEDDVLLAGGLD